MLVQPRALTIGAGHLQESAEQCLPSQPYLALSLYHSFGRQFSLKKNEFEFTAHEHISRKARRQHPRPAHGGPSKRGASHRCASPSSDSGYHIVPKYSSRRIKRAQTKVLGKTNQTSPNSMGLRRLITEFLWPPSSSIIRLWLPYSTKVLGKTNETSPNSMGLRRLITEFLWTPSSSIIRLWLPYSTKVLGKTNQTSPNSMGLRRLITEFPWLPSSSIIRLWLPYSTKVLVKTNQTSPNSMGLRRLITEFLWPPSSSIIRLWLPYSTKVLGKTNQTSPNSMGLAMPALRTADWMALTAVWMELSNWVRSPVAPGARRCCASTQRVSVMAFTSSAAALAPSDIAPSLRSESPRRADCRQSVD
ncbi:hypothetical protein EVAR_92753_1 [Eumeta japonica]|uniref:Uncharacterized protein n=1 Tax=Eumeta variegata TaxID=151549 RepID=A0A4C1SY43_EUMVA|nr:hypothetical protein EVAR_92753_1 [Eumeta japonica]